MALVSSTLKFGMIFIIYRQTMFKINFKVFLRNFSKPILLFLPPYASRKLFEYYY